MLALPAPPEPGETRLTRMPWGLPSGPRDRRPAVRFDRGLEPKATDGYRGGPRRLGLMDSESRAVVTLWPPAGTGLIDRSQSPDPPYPIS